MWTRMLFWKRKLNRIYTACPEIRHIVDQQARRTIMNAVRLTVTFPLWVPWLVLIGVMVSAERIAGHMVDFSMPLVRWTYRDDGGELTRQAHKILPPDEIRRRVKGDS